MAYISLNKWHRNRINGMISREVKFEWEYPELMNLLLGMLPKRRYSRYDDSAVHEIADLDKMLANYDCFCTDKNSFVADVNKKIGDIQTKANYWMGITSYEIENTINMHKFCILYGEGGIGKTYFIKCLEEQLELMKIPHLCVYGKFLQKIEDISAEEIIKASESGFVFIVDAINEISDESNKILIEIFKKFKEFPKIRIIVTYRTNILQEDILAEYHKLAYAEHQFQGVSFYSALDGLIESAVPDVYKYEDILYSNNALLLGGLHNWLASGKVLNEEENSVASITYIYENIIKNAIKKHIDNDKVLSRKIWDDVKDIAKWMFDHNQKFIDYDSLYSTIHCKSRFIPVMEQMGFMHSIGNQCYVFSLDLISDYLIGRSLFKALENKSDDEVIQIIKEKTVKFSSLSEAFILAVFDLFGEDYEKVKSILIKTDLIVKFNYSVLAKIVFNKSSFENFRKFFMPIDKEKMFLDLGGFNNKPFNCENYFYAYYKNNMQGLVKLSEALSGKHKSSTVANRLKNILYFINYATVDSSKTVEAFEFAVLCCCAPNQNVRALATKLLYDIVENYKSNNGESTESSECFLDKLVEAYSNFPDYYIRESIIYVLSKQEYSTNIAIFYKDLIQSDNTLTARSIGRIAAFLGNRFDYINWVRDDLYVQNSNTQISEYMNDLLFNIDGFEKELLPFRYFGENTINIFRQFLNADKNTVGQLNNFLADRYRCVKNGYCSGGGYFHSIIESTISDVIDIKNLELKSFICSFEQVVLKISEIYEQDLENQKKFSYDEFSSSSFRKCIDIAIGIFYGSLMCNYYINEIVSYNTCQNTIGFEVYDPLYYEDSINLTTPLPNYNGLIEKLGNLTTNKIDVQRIKDDNWSNDTDLLRNNVLKLLEPIKANGNEWILLGGRISLKEDNRNGDTQKETYDIWCCTSDDITLNNDETARYLTIELEDYDESLYSYKEHNEKSYLCKRVKAFSTRLDALGETNLVLPPADFVKILNLHLRIKDVAWCDATKEAIVCSNVKSYYYKDPISSGIYIRRDFFDEFVKNNPLKYFAYAERVVLGSDVENVTRLHFEIKDGVINKEVSNDSYKSKCNSEIIKEVCEICPVKIEAENRITNFNFEEFFVGEDKLED